MLYQKLLIGTSPYFAVVSQGGPFELHQHPETELSYCIKGSYNIFIDQKEYIISEGYLAIINPLSSHELGNYYSDDCLHLTLEVGPALLGEEFSPFLTICPDKAIFHLKDNNKPLHKELYALLNETAEFVTQKPLFSNLSVKGNIYKICSVLLNLFVEQNSLKVTHKSLMDIEKIGYAINMIYNKYYEKLDLDTVSSLCGYSKSNFCKAFKDITGESFHTMLNKHRTEIACMHLREIHAPVEEIALSVGFPDSKSFCRVFKKITGMSAGEYRKSKK